MNNSHEAFIKRLDNSRPSTFIVAQYLHRHGWDVNVPAFIYPEPNSNWEDNVDDGDIYIEKVNNGPHRIDVKHVNLDFTCRDDFPHSHMFVADIRAIERAKPFPLAYVVVNKPATHIGIIWYRTKEFWEPHDVHASNTNKMITVMRCPLEWVDFRPIND